MRDESLTFSLPRWRPTRWLAETGPDVPQEIRLALIGTLYGTLPIFFGGVVNTLTVCALIASRKPTPPFLAWLAIETAICLIRLVLLRVSFRAAGAGRATPTDLVLLFALAWAASLGFGLAISLASGDWVVATLACLSSAAMVGGTCFRNFAAPRLTAAMIALTLCPCCLGAALSGEPILLVTFLQVPFYLLAMTSAAFRLNRMTVATMRAERESAFRAHHDTLTGLANRAGLAKAAETGLDGALGPAGLLYLDLDGFKAVNDTHGHGVGDRLLQIVAERIRGTLAPGEVAARLGGDEFVVLCRGRSRAALIGLGETLIARLGAPYACGAEASVQAGASVGLALAPEHGADLASLLQAADRALYRSKSIGKGRCTLAARRRPEREEGGREPEGTPEGRLPQDRSDMPAQARLSA